MKAILALEDGLVLKGETFAGSGEVAGEVVFNTSMSGYEEILTDPSYKGQIVTMTYPLIGNYGINEEDYESIHPWVEGFIVREYSEFPSNWRSRASLRDFLEKHEILGIQGIDTRALTKHIRQAGAMKGIISTQDLDPERLIYKAKISPGLLGRDLVREVTCRREYGWREERPFLLLAASGEPEAQFNVVVVDYGVKHNSLRLLAREGCRITVVPASTSAERIMELDPDGVLLSNGPGDPAGVPYAAEEVKKLLDRVPIFGICFGHQIMGRAFGLDTYKLKFGHHGANHPVKDLVSGKVEITAQNHGFCVRLEHSPSSWKASSSKGLIPTHINLNDNTLEGMRHQELPVFSVQYHPESSPGPHDSRYLFKRFIDLMEKSSSSSH
jgi:carbamoyl-phosphate synthase small subunit